MVFGGNHDGNQIPCSVLGLLDRIQFFPGDALPFQSSQIKDSGYIQPGTIVYQNLRDISHFFPSVAVKGSVLHENFITHAIPVTHLGTGF